MMRKSAGFLAAALLLVLSIPARAATLTLSGSTLSISIGALPGAVFTQSPASISVVVLWPYLRASRRSLATAFASASARTCSVVSPCFSAIAGTRIETFWIQRGEDGWVAA